MEPRLSSWRTHAVALFAALSCLLGRAHHVHAETAERAESAESATVLAHAEADDDALRFAAALAGYEEALRLDPTTPKAMHAASRAKVLRTHAEGDFAPFATLERIRRDPTLASNPAAIDALIRAADAFPPGLVRLEAWTLAAEAYATRLGRPSDALPLWQRIAADPLADPVVARGALQSWATHELTLGNYTEAEAVASHPRADAPLARTVRRALRRHRLHLLALTLLGLGGLGAALTLARAGRRQAVLARTKASAPLLLGYAAYVAVAGALLANGYEGGTAQPFLLFGLALAPILLVARAWAAAGSPTPLARGLRAAICATSVLGAAFLVVEHVDVSYLEGLGL